MNSSSFPPAPPPAPQLRYEPLLKIASGGTATVWVGAATGALGFRQLVAIKRPHDHLADDPTFIAALVEEAKIASRLRHANAVDVRDVEILADGVGRVQLVMDWVEGASVSELIRAWQKTLPARPHAVAIRIVLDACEGLSALHELTSEDGAPLGCVHRDVSPANILVGHLDGVSRITDFGLARPLLAVERSTMQGTLRGKIGYMAPEYIAGKKDIDRRVDVFAMGIVLWETLARKRLFRGENDADALQRVQHYEAPRLEIENAPELDALLARALAKDPNARFASMRELATELERIARSHDMVATHAEVRESFGPTLSASLDERRREVERALANVSAAAAAVVAVAARTETTRRDAPHSLPPLQTNPRPTNRSPILAATAAVVFVLAVVGVASAAYAFRAPSDRGVVVAASPHVIESDVQPLNDEPRTRAAAGSSASSSSAFMGSAASGVTRLPRVDPGGNKVPRPNPYVTGKRP